MDKKEKNELIYLLSFGGIYILLNFIPFRLFMEEVPYLVFRLISYFFLMILVIFFKLRNEIEIPRPAKRLHFLFLIPFLVPCFADLFYASIFEAEFQVRFSWFVLIMETIIDLFDSVVEDVIFVDVMISFLYHIFRDSERRNLHSMVVSAFIFTAVRTYVFFTYDFDDALFNLAVTWLITFACGYLAIYYDSEWVPITFHFLFNVPNFVIAPILFDYETELEYYLFISVFIVPLLIYTIICYHLSERKLKGVGNRKPEENTKSA